MKLHPPLPRHTETRFIRLDPHRCEACWTCVQTCPNNVLGKAELLAHRHAHVDHAENCKGCKKCVNVCPNAAISYTYRPLGYEDSRPS
ncbi:MAG: ferredoxin family protein [Chloroflexi bacterium]|nr:ferredoxin family protein [Chloroflexota bacterium]